MMSNFCWWILFKRFLATDTHTHTHGHSFTTWYFSTGGNDGWKKTYDYEDKNTYSINKNAHTMESKPSSSSAGCQNIEWKPCIRYNNCMNSQVEQRPKFDLHCIREKFNPNKIWTSVGKYMHPSQRQFFVVVFFLSIELVFCWRFLAIQFTQIRYIHMLRLWFCRLKSEQTTHGKRLNILVERQTNIPHWQWLHRYAIRANVTLPMSHDVCVAVMPTSFVRVESKQI